MKSIQAFNNLHQNTVTRQEIERVIALATAEEQLEPAQRLQHLLNSNHAKSFNIDLVFPAFPQVPNSIIDCLHCDTDATLHRLGKSVSTDDIYKMVTDLMINTINEIGHLPWQKEWIGSGIIGACNFVTGKPYTGINFLMLNFITKHDKNGLPYLVAATDEKQYYLTFNQIESYGAILKKGSKGREVIYYNFVLNYKDDKAQFSGTDANKFEKFAKDNNLSAEQVKSNLKRIPILKYYNVFNSNDCTGLPDPKEYKKEVKTIDYAQFIIDNYPNKPDYRFGSEKAFYVPSQDYVSMPLIGAFTKEESYYSTFFHEIVHSTGHKSRLDRNMSGRFGNSDYAFEELIAELGAVFLCSESGILFKTINNSAKYLQGWNERLISKLKEDNRFFMKAAAASQKAANYILNSDKKYITAKIVVKKPVKKTDPEKSKTTQAELKKLFTEAGAKTNKPRTKRATKPIIKVDAKTRQIALFRPKKKTVVKKKKPLNGIIDNLIVSTILAEPEIPIFHANKLMQIKFEVLPINDEWKELMQNPASNMKIAIWGPPKNGKTAASLQMANYLTNFGNVLYNFSDQGFSKSTQDLWITSGLSKNSKATPSDISNSVDLEKEVATGKYKFVFIDMISDFIRNEKLRPEEFKERFIKKHPNTSFILIFEVTKGGNFKGDQGWTHLVDAIMTVDDFLLENRGRYGMGHRVIWEDGFKKFNPKKYQDYIENKQENEVEQPQPFAALSEEFNFEVH